MKGESGEPVFFVQKNDCEWLKKRGFWTLWGGQLPGQMNIEDYQKGGQAENERTAAEKEE